MDGLKAIYSDKAGMSVAELLQNLNVKDKNIDIQVCIRGNERLAGSPAKPASAPKRRIQS